LHFGCRQNLYQIATNCPATLAFCLHDEDGGQVEVLMVMVMAMLMTVLTCEAGSSSPGVNELFASRN